MPDSLSRREHKRRFARAWYAANRQRHKANVLARRARQRAAVAAAELERRCGPLADRWLSGAVCYRLRKGERALLSLFFCGRMRVLR